MKNKNIVIAPCGNKSDMFMDHWLKDKNDKQFDVCLLFYHEKINNPDLYKEVDYFFHLKDFKYFMLHKLFTEIKPGWLDEYDYFYFLDDDIKIETHQINLMFQLSNIFKSEISQASLSQNSFCSWPMFKKQKNSFLRFVGQVEVMAPLFSRSALIKCLPSFIGNRSSWGVDSVWSKILGYAKDKLIVFDAVVMEHTKPVGGGELYEKIGINPHTDWKNIITKYDAKKENYTEYGRLALIDTQHHKLSFLRIKGSELVLRIKRAWNDYDLQSRIDNKLKRFKK